MLFTVGGTELCLELLLLPFHKPESWYGTLALLCVDMGEVAAEIPV